MSIVKYRRPGRRSRSDAISRAPFVRGIQIGPRIRIGGTLGKIGEGIKKVVPSPAAMIGGAALGPVGMLAGSAINGSVGEDFTKGLKNAGLIFGAQKLLGGAGTPAGGAGGGDQSLLDKLKSMGMSGIEGLSSIFGDGNVGDKLLTGASIASAAADKARQNDLQNQSIKYARDPYDAKAGLRSSAITGLSTPQKFDLSSIFADPGNVYDQQRRGKYTPPSQPPAAAAATSGTALTDALRQRAAAMPA